jgi:hypothetical protein
VSTRLRERNRYAPTSKIRAVAVINDTGEAVTQDHAGPANVLSYP